MTVFEGPGEGGKIKDFLNFCGRESPSEMARVNAHAERSHTDVKDHVVHARVWWIVEMPK